MRGFAAAGAARLGQGSKLMMAAVFAALSAAFLLGWAGRRRAAAVAAFLCLALAVKLFLFEIYSPEYGFRMPWIQTEAPLAPYRHGVVA